MITAIQLARLTKDNKIVWIKDGSSPLKVSDKWLLLNLNANDYQQLMHGWEIWKDVKVKGKYENRVYRRISTKK